MLTIGCHLSVSKGFYAMGQTALSIKANTFQFFTRNPRGGSAKALDPKDIAEFLKLAQDHDFKTLLAHAPYTLNPCSSDPKVREFALQTMTDDLARMALLPNNYYNFHPGSHTGQGADAGIEQIAALLNRVLKPEQTTTVLLETMAGKGTEIGRSFEELREILNRVEHKDKMGVCLDTCHVHDGGYDLIDGLEAVLEAFDRTIGIGKLRAVHLNDSLNPRGSHKDRHARIGEGALGVDAIARIINHPSLRQLPFFLETPNELEGYGEEIALLRGLYR